MPRRAGDHHSTGHQKPCRDNPVLPAGHPERKNGKAVTEMEIRENVRLARI